jgi:hypothetical protein
MNQGVFRATLRDLHKWNLIRIKAESKNQYTSTIICLTYIGQAKDKHGIAAGRAEAAYINDHKHLKTLKKESLKSKMEKNGIA